MLDLNAAQALCEADSSSTEVANNALRLPPRWPPSTSNPQPVVAEHANAIRVRT